MNYTYFGFVIAYKVSRLNYNQYLVKLLSFAAFFILIAIGFTIRSKNLSSSFDTKKIVETDTSVRLKEIAKFPVGASVDPHQLYTNDLYAAIVKNQFNSITTENALKWQAVQPKIDSFNFNKGDSIVAFAKINNLRVHGHALVTVSTASLPKWVNNFKGDSVAWENMFKNHIQSVVAHYKEKIKSWDVVNETFDEKGQIRSSPQAGNDANIWLSHLGKDYTARAFQYAHEANPAALLFYNDNKQEYFEKKLDAIINMVNDFKKRNIPIDGLGIQMHINIRTSNAGIANALKKLAATGLKIHISELDIRLNPNNKLLIDSAAVLKAQADKFYFVAHAYKTLVPPNQQYGITFWNVTDKDSWIVLTKHVKESPLLFNIHYGKKKSFQSFAAGLK